MLLQHRLGRTYSLTLFLGLFLVCMLVSSSLSTSIFNLQKQALAQQYIPTIKYRNLVIDLGNGVKTKAQLTLPVIGKGPFPAVVLIQGSGALDMNSTFTKNAKLFWQIAQYLSERGFAVLRYDKRGIGATSYTISNSNVWGNATANDFMRDAQKALNVLIQQPEVDPKRISILGHSEGTLYAPRIAIDNSTKVKNVILMAALALNPAKVRVLSSGLPTPTVRYASIG
jgi:alpha-beta hydrolase superfamily lysophospholipase